MKPYDTPVWQRATGQWDEIYSALAPELDLARHRPGRHTACPVHKGIHNDAFRLFPDFSEEGAGVCNTCGKFGSGVKLLAWLKGWTNAKACEEVATFLDGGQTQIHAPARKIVVSKDTNNDDFRIRSLVDTWSATVGLGHPDAYPAWEYLIRRGLVPLDGPLDDIRFHRGLDYWDEGKKLGRFPALICAVRQSDGEPATLHRIYLTEDGAKAPVPTPKKMMQLPSVRSTNGAAIRLDDASGSILHVAEGVETALAVRIITGEPTWAVISTSIMTSLAPPAHITSVCIWADRDPKTGRGLRPGQDAANKTLMSLRERGVNCLIMLPPVIGQPDEGIDWNDVLERFGAEAIRRWTFYSELRKSLSAPRSRGFWRRSAK